MSRGLCAAEAADDWASALAAIRFLVVTGWRNGEALTLRWSEVDLARRTARLASTKTGSSTRALSGQACAILLTMGQGEYVFPAPGGDTPMTNFARVWRPVVHRTGGLPMDVTPHVLRHSFASLAADLGLADATIAAMLGHKGHTITRRYIHSADAALLAATDTGRHQSYGIDGGGRRGDEGQQAVEHLRCCSIIDGSLETRGQAVQRRANLRLASSSTQATWTRSSPSSASS